MFKNEPIYDIKGNVLYKEVLLNTHIPNHVLFHTYNPCLEKWIFINFVEYINRLQEKNILYAVNISWSFLNDNIDYISNLFETHSFLIEITELNSIKTHISDKTVNFINQHHTKIIIDDFMSGYNNFYLLCVFKPTLLKIESNIIRNADLNYILRSFLEYTQKNNISLIGEKIENSYDLCSFIKNNINYFQGYYINKEVILDFFKNENNRFLIE